MRYLIDFLSKSNVADTLIYPHLKCTNQEGAILRHLLQLAINGEMEARVYDVLYACFFKPNSISHLAQAKLPSDADSRPRQNLKVSKPTPAPTDKSSSKSTAKSTSRPKQKPESSTQEPVKSSSLESTKPTSAKLILAPESNKEHGESSSMDFATLAPATLEKLAILEYVGAVKLLLDSGWISVMEFNFMREQERELASLELLFLEIALAPSFYHLVENGTTPQPEIPSNTPYNDHLEYLTDQFLRISLLTSLRSKKSAATSSQIRSLQERIDSRLKCSKIDIPAQNLMKECHLSKKEEIIFFALLKEEYYGGDGYYRDMNNLINLISTSEYEKIQNRALLDEKGTLVEKGLLDFGEMLNPFGGIVRTFFIPEEILRKIIKSPKKRSGKISLATALVEQEIFELIEPKVGFDEIVLPESTHSMLESILKQVDSAVIKRLQEWGIIHKNKGVQAKILFYGAAGTGKTLSAQGIAKALKKPILSFDCSKILSMYVGESEKNVRKIFDSYKELAAKSKTTPVLLLDEADQFLSSRIHSLSGAEKMHNQMQNIFLEQIERFSGVLIATTNLVETMDSAFSRRFDYKIEFKRPDIGMRKRLWQKFLPKNAQYDMPESTLIKRLSQYDLSGAQIELVVKNTAYKVATQASPIFREQDFIAAITREIHGGFDGSKSVGFSAI